ncbi:MAG: hypothetical protein JHC33_13030 [Ignisphaera sp.]|jgi:hypothetical protein|nr:hypothetical protein [Ignisphaera sp.]
MMTEREELEKSITTGKLIAKLSDTDEFKELRRILKEEVGQELVLRYAYRDEATRNRMQEQMIMISAFENFITGTIQKGEIDAIQLQELLERSEVGDE